LPTTVSVVLTLSGCGGGSDGHFVLPPVAPQPVALSCDDSIKTGFKPDANTTVLAVKAFKKGDPYPNPTLESLVTPTASTVAQADLCLVKLLVGPGNPGPAGAPSTSAGIGIEVWLPLKKDWNGRVHAIGGGGWVGGEETDVAKISSASAAVDGRSAPGVAADEGAVTSTTDTGHTGGFALGGSFAMNPDGTISTRQWEDFSERSIQEQIVKTKALATAYYGSAPKYTYWDGNSKGGRQALKVAQRFPEMVDGIVTGNPAINWSSFITADVYPQVVIQRDLGGNYMSAEQLTRSRMPPSRRATWREANTWDSSSIPEAAATTPRRIPTCSVPQAAGATAPLRA
jgi:feruloyl esterase